MLLRPRIKLTRITDVTLSLLEKYGIKSLILDVDNTLSTHHGTVLTDGLEEWLDTMGNAGINGAISGGADTFLSKNKARTFDATLSRWTKYIAILFFVMSIIANVIALRG